MQDLHQNQQIFIIFSHVNRATNLIPYTVYIFSLLPNNNNRFFFIKNYSFMNTCKLKKNRIAYSYYFQTFVSVTMATSPCINRLRLSCIFNDQSVSKQEIQRKSVHGLMHGHRLFIFIINKPINIFSPSFRPSSICQYRWFSIEAIPVAGHVVHFYANFP